jgi:class 3 adenylate cyclase
MVGHTEMMHRLGDSAGRDVLRLHEEVTREVLRTHGGDEVKSMGDGFMASFASVTGAVECAIALQRSFEERHHGPGGDSEEPIHIRIGVNAGEPIEEGGDLFGSTVIMASRIAAQAGAGEILTSDVVRGLCSGKGFLFADRGENVLRGFEDQVRLYEVRWRE